MSSAVWPMLSPRDFDIKQTTSNTFLVYFIACQAFGGFGLLAILITALAKKKQRYASWINFCIAWILSCISYLLLTFLGQQGATEPNKHICFVQAVLIYGAPVLTALSTLALVMQLWYASTLDDLHGWKLIGLIAAPWTVYTGILVEAFFIGYESEEHIKRLGSSIYCVITNGIPGKISALIVACAMLITLVFEGILVRTLYMNWQVFRDVDVHGASVSRQLMVRIAVFGIFQITALGASIAIALEVTDMGPNGLIALMPVVAFLVFGTQKDLIESWACWKRRRPTKVRSEDARESMSLMPLV